MPFDSRLTKPEDYLKSASSQAGRKFFKDKKVDYAEAFKSKPSEPPFTINRFDTSDLRRRLTSKKPVLNPRLNFVGGDPEQFQLFTGLPRFDSAKGDLYDFNTGRPQTKALFTEYPEFKPLWVELYEVSPTLEKRARNPMPRSGNPDPLGRIMERAELAAEREMERDYSVAQLLKGEGSKEVARGKQSEEEDKPLEPPKPDSPELDKAKSA